MSTRRRCGAGAIVFATLALLVAPTIATARRTSENGPLFATQLLLSGCIDDCENASNDWCLWVRRPGRACTRVRGGCPSLEPLVSPNGRWVVHERWSPAALVVRRLHGSPPRMGRARAIVPAPAQVSPVGPRFRYGWSADSRRIAVMTANDVGVTLTIADRNGTRQRSRPCACPAAESQLAWSPKDRIAYMHEGALSTVAPTGRDARQLAGTAESCGNSLAAPAWSPDGRAIVFACRRRLVSLDARSLNTRTVFEIRRLDPCVAPSSDPLFHALAWSPDGRSIAYGDDCDIVEMRDDGSRPRRLPLTKRMFFLENLTWALASPR